MSIKDILKSKTNNKAEANYYDLLVSYRKLSDEVKKLREENDRLEFINRKTAAFNNEILGNISHEIKTSFYGILNSVSLLKDIKNLNEGDTNNLQVVEQNSQYLLTALNDVLDYYSIKNRSIKLDKVNFSLKNEVTPLLEYYKKKADEKGLEIKVEFSQNNPKYLKGDPLRVKQIIHQLLSNSIKYTSEGYIGVKIFAYNIDYRTFDINIIITDTGQGIDEEQKVEIWHTFSSIEKQKHYLNNGLGMGLPIVKQLVDLMNGKVVIESKRGIGSTFSVLIPFELGTSDRSDIYKNILLVEDNIINQRLTKTILERQGFNVDTASNGVIGVDKYRQNKYDLVLMDIQMPVMDGFEAARQIRDFESLNPLIKPVTIIAVSANSGKNDLKLLSESGIDNFINKPFNIDKFSMLLCNL